MAVEPQKPKSRKKQQIEPLDWSTMSQSPALKGMVSFLEVTPEDIRRQQGRNGDSRTGSDTSIGIDSHTGSAPRLNFPKFSKPMTEARTGSDPRTVSDPRIGSDISTGSEALTGSESRTPVSNLSRQAGAFVRTDVPVGDTHTGTHSRTDSDTHTGSETSTGEAADAAANNSEQLADTPRSSELLSTSQASASASADSRRNQLASAEVDTHIGTETRIGGDTRTGSDIRIGSRNERSNVGNAANKLGDGIDSSSFDELVNPIRDSHIGVGTRTGSEPRPGSDSGIGESVRDSRIGAKSAATYFVGSEQYPRPQRRMPMLQGEVVWQNRKIRKCVLAQDAHSQGEDALFSAMWNAAKPDASDPSGSRTLRIGYAELAQKSRMHRSNIRINIAGLRAKLAIEVLDEHDSRDVMPRLYRLYSYKEILERRKAAGLEYVIRKKSVVFVTESGELVTLPGLPKTAVRNTKRRSDSSDQATTDLPTQEARAEQLDLDVRQISDALSQHWPVDEAAAQQLLRQCRSIRRDAEIDEIVFFINEKLQIALTNRNIKNPTGLILATVPQCFEGATFQEFRRRRNEGLRAAAEEQERKRQQERELQAWLDGKLQELRGIADDESQSDSAREKARKELRQYGG